MNTYQKGKDLDGNVIVYRNKENFAERYTYYKGAPAKIVYTNSNGETEEYSYNKKTCKMEQV